MEFPVQFVVLSILCLVTTIEFSEASYECGIRKHGFHSLISHGWQVEDGSWPWHVALFHRNATGQFEYACGGTLVNEWHVLTVAHCVVKRKATKSLPAIMYEIELHFGQHNLSIADDVVIRDVKKAHVHPEYTTHRNDIAVLVMRLAVEYSEYITPICLDRKVDRDLRDLEHRHGWVTGWGRTENGTISDVLRTLSLPVASYIQCLKDDPLLFGNVLDEKVFCAGNRNGTSLSQGDSGGGFFFSDGDRWVLRGIASIGKMFNSTEGIDPSKYIVFVNVQRYLKWIGEIFAESDPRRRNKQERISEIECKRFQTLAAKRRNGDCYNNRYPHHVMVVRPDGTLLGNGVLVNELNVLTTCSCIRDHGESRYHPAKVRIDVHGDVAVSEMFCHPNYTEDYHNDLAILKLDEYEQDIVLKRNLIPACLANNWTENLYDSLQKNRFIQMSQINTSVLVESFDTVIVSKDVCYNMLDHQLLDGDLCVVNRGIYDTADVNRIEQRLAIGDVLQSSNKRSCMFTLVGLKSGADHLDEDCVAENNSYSAYAAYARISHHLDWIEQAVWNKQAEDDDCGDIDGFHNAMPWIVPIYHWNTNGSLFEFSCSGSLISMKHILTTAQCVMNCTTGRPLLDDSFELHAGQQFLNQRHINEQIRYVSEVHVHPEYAIHDIAILVASWPFINTKYVKPICVDSSKNTDPWNLEEVEIYTTRWRMLEPEMESGEREELVLNVIEQQQCSEVSQKLRGKPLAPNVLCSVFHTDDGDEDEAEASEIADSGLAVFAELFGNPTDGYDYYSVGIVSSIIKGNGTRKYALFVNLQPYISWIEGIVSQSGPLREKERLKRISEKECDRFGSLSEKINGVCVNAENLNHIVLLLDEENNFICSGVLVKEDRVLTACECISGQHRPTKVKITSCGVVDILKMICHPDYNSTNHYHDFAVLQLVNPVELSSRLIPACLANTWTENLSKIVLYSVFARTSDAGNPQLRSKYDSIGTKELCESIEAVEGETHVFGPSQTCISLSWAKRDWYKYGYLDPDYIVGGGVVQSDNSLTCQFTMIGSGSNKTYESSFGPLHKMAIVHRVAYYLDWIEQVVWEEESSAYPQNWIFVVKQSSSGTAQRYNLGPKLLVLFIALATIL